MSPSPLVCELEDSLKGDRENSNVDYYLVVSAWSEIYNSVKQLNENYSELIGHISKEFGVIINDDFALSGTLDPISDNKCDIHGKV